MKALSKSKISNITFYIKSFELEFFGQNSESLLKRKRRLICLYLLYKRSSIFLANVAFAALMSADVGVWDNPSEMRSWAKGQIDYMLGTNPNSRSYVVGFGTNPPTQAHHVSR